MKHFLPTLIIFCLFNLFSFAQTNTFPATGNVGIGTTNPAGNLDVYSAYYSGGYKFIDNVQIPTVGFLNPIALGLRQGKRLFPDEEFKKGLNNIVIYDNVHTGEVDIERTDTISDLPNGSGYGLKFTHSGYDPGPGFGGFYQVYNASANRTIVQIFRAKLPTGYKFNIGSNAVGNGGTNYWLSNDVGTGKWEWYVRVTQCGYGGSYSNAGHIYVTGYPAPSSASPLVWYMASCTAFDITNLSENKLLNQTATDQEASFRINGEGMIGDRLLIGKTSQLNNNYKLDVSGDARVDKIVVNTTGADFVFAPDYRLTPIDSVENFIKVNHHLPGVASATKMQHQGLDVGQNQTVLLQKVEELTLYLIALNKQQIKQQRKIKKLEKANLFLQRQLKDLNTISK